MSFCQLLLLTHALFLQSKFRCELNCASLLCLYWFETSCILACTTQTAFYFNLQLWGTFPHPGIFLTFPVTLLSLSHQNSSKLR